MHGQRKRVHLDRLTPAWLPTPAQQRLATLILATSVGLLAGMIYGLFNGLVFGLVRRLIGGLFFGGLACLQHLTVRGLPVVHGLAPWRYVRFLDDATEQLFLRRAGSGYIFIHRLLLEHFADMASCEDAIRQAAACQDETTRPLHQ